MPDPIVVAYTTNTTAFPSSQEDHIAGGVWVDEPAAVVLAAAGTAGLIFDTGLTNVSGRTDLFQDPPIFSGFALSLTPTTLSETATLTFTVVPERDPLNYTTALAPGARSETACGTVSLAAADSGTPITTTLTFAAIQLQTIRAGWAGRIAISLAWGGAASLTLAGGENATSANRPILNATQIPFHTGFMDMPDQPGRATHDDRMGLPILGSQRVRDGFNEGLFVQPWDYDPPDENFEHIPPSSEGVTDDDPV